MKLQLYYFDGCPYCDYVQEHIESLGLTALVELCNIKKNAQFLNKLLADTKRKTVPCLYIDNKPMHESRDIVHWLEQNSKAIKQSHGS
jgi:glutaredoxin